MMEVVDIDLKITVLRGGFDEYMQNLSLSVLDDRLFESILLRLWNFISHITKL